MIAVKAARMKCVIVPLPAAFSNAKWSAADIKLQSLTQFGEATLNQLMQ
jgi:sugar-phosphatase